MFIAACCDRVQIIIAEGDSRTIFTVLSSSPRNCFLFYHLIQEAKGKCSHFRKIVFNLIPFSCNRAALALALGAQCGENLNFWLEDTLHLLPSCYKMMYALFN